MTSMTILTLTNTLTISDGINGTVVNLQGFSIEITQATEGVSVLF
jgi:hypothetical protein